MRSRLLAARSLLLANATLWFGVPLLGILFESRALVALQLSLVARWPWQSYAAILLLTTVASCLYPKRRPGAKRLLILPFVGTVLSLLGYAWLDGELTSDDAGCYHALLGLAGLFLLSLPLAGLWRTRHAMLLAVLPTLLVGTIVEFRACNALDRWRSRSRGARIVRALDAHRQRTGGYPASLEELVPRDLDRVPRPHRWFWRGPHFRYAATGRALPDDLPTTYTLTFAHYGDFSYGRWTVSSFQPWTYGDDFPGQPHFDHPFPPGARGITIGG